MNLNVATGFRVCLIQNGSQCCVVYFTVVKGRVIVERSVSNVSATFARNTVIGHNNAEGVALVVALNRERFCRRLVAGIRDNSRLVVCADLQVTRDVDI